MKEMYTESESDTDSEDYDSGEETTDFCTCVKTCTI